MDICQRFSNYQYKHAALTGKPDFLLENAAINIPSLWDSRGFLGMQGLCLKPDAVGMQVAFGRVRRKTAPTNLGDRGPYFS